MPNRMRLTDVNLVETLKSPELKGFISKFNIKRYPKKQIITSPGQEENFVFLIESGRVRVFLTYEDKEFTLSILEAGDIFSSHTRAFTQTLEDSTLMLTDIKTFNEMISTIPPFALTMIKVLGDLLRNSFSVIDGLVFKEAYHRLAELLVHTADEKGTQVTGGIRLELGLSTEQIAMLLGTTRQTVSTLLSGFQKDGMIEKPGRGIIVITEIEKLRQLVEGSS